MEKNTNKPFYKNGLFWAAIITAVIVILIIVFVIFEYVSLQQHLSETVEKAFYESGKGGTKITDIADDFESIISQSTT